MGRSTLSCLMYVQQVACAADNANLLIAGSVRTRGFRGGGSSSCQCCKGSHKPAEREAERSINTGSIDAV
jgi:hypothetical protein